MGSWKQLVKNFDKQLDHEDIDEFRDHLNHTFDKKLKILQNQYDNATEKDVEDPRDLEPYKDHLQDIMMTTYSSKLLGYELSIIALYKRVEIKTGKVVKRHLSGAANKDVAYFKTLCCVLPFDIKTVDDFNSFNELRLLNNAIKHGGIVSDELATNYPKWNVGEELKGLDKEYNRLLPGVINYFSDLVEKIYAYNKKKP